MNKRLTLGLTVLALTSTALASTWDAYDHMLYQLQRQGYEETVRSVNGYLPEGQEAQWTFRGLGGDAYAAFAVCDEDCSGLGVEVYDQQDRLVDSDSGTETPLATFDVGRTQTYTVVFEMQQCADTACAYRLGIAHDDR